MTPYFYEHTRPIRGRDGFFRVTAEMHVFKRTFLHLRNGLTNRVIVNLVIPVGAKVYWEPQGFQRDINNRKIRCSKAFVHSQFTQSSKTALDVSRSGWDNTEYHTGKFVRPDYFSKERDTCSAGIHFFLNLQDALKYNS
jgi:hypothetical protein